MNLYSFGAADKEGACRANWDPKHSNWVTHIWQEGKATPIATCREATQEACESTARRVREALEMQARLESPEFLAKLKSEVEACLETRLREVHGINTKSSHQMEQVKAMNIQREFLLGASKAVGVLLPNSADKADELSSAVPPIWIVCLMSGRSPLLTKNKKA